MLSVQSRQSLSRYNFNEKFQNILYSTNNDNIVAIFMRVGNLGWEILCLEKDTKMARGCRLH